MKKYTQIFVMIAFFVILSQSFTLFSSKNTQNKIESDQNIEVQNCNATNFEFYGLKYFLLEPQMKLAMDYMNKDFTNLTETSYRADEVNSYNIYRPKASYVYKNPNVSANFVSQKQIRVSGGYIEVTIQFDWSHYVNYSTIHKGKGTAFGVTDQIPYAIQSDGSYILGIGLLQSRKLNQLKLTRLDTENQQKDPSTDTEKFIMNYILNNLPKDSLRQIAEYKLSQLSTATYKAHRQAIPSSNPQSYYVWVDTCVREDIFFASLVKNYTLTKSVINSTNPGFYLSYWNNITNYPDAACGKLVPQTPLDPTKYGTSQQFFSFTLLENILKLGIQKNKLNAKINRQNWGTKSFKFTAKELSFIFSNITQNFVPSQSVEGQCQPDVKTLKFIKGSNTTFNVSMTHNCSLRIKTTKIVEFVLNLTVEVEGSGKEMSLDFYANSFSSTVVYNDTFGFKMQNKVLADVNMRETLNRICESLLFGSGLNLGMKRVAPQMAVVDSAILVFDAKK